MEGLNISYFYIDGFTDQFFAALEMYKSKMLGPSGQIIFTGSAYRFNQYGIFPADASAVSFQHYRI